MRSLAIRPEEIDLILRMGESGYYAKKAGYQLHEHNIVGKGIAQ